jgi:AraC family transcriptional regulator
VVPYSTVTLPAAGKKAFDFEYYDEHCHYWDYDKVYMEIHIPINERG